MGTMTIGRCGLDVVMDSQNAPATFEVSGDDIRITGVLRASTLPDVGFLRFQLNGLVDNEDEPFVPFTWSEDSSFDSFVVVNSVRISTLPMSLTAKWFPFELSMTLLASGAYAPQVQSRLQGALRVNAHGIVLANLVPWWATPADATMDYVYSATRQTRTGDGGSVIVNYRTDGTILMDRSSMFQIAPPDWYDMSAKIELSFDGGTTWRAWVGQQILNVPTVWRISNGFVRVTYGGGNGLISVEHHDGTQWETATKKTYKLTYTPTAGSPTTIGAFRTMSVLRNAPESVTLRLTVEQDATAFMASINVDITLRRGSRYIEVLMTRSALEGPLWALGYEMGVYRNTAEAATAHTSGLHATAADGGGNKYTMATSKAKTNDLTQGGFSESVSSTAFWFMIGLELGGASGSDTFTNLTYGSMTTVRETMSLVAR